MARIKQGDKAPDFTVKAHSGESITLSDLLRTNVVVLFFYPKDGTSVCTAEACAFRDAYQDFVKAGAAVIGISADDEASHNTFAAQHQLPYHLISDTDGSLRKAFGVPKTLGLLPGRVTYVIDQTGVVRLVFQAALGSESHVREALAMVKELKVKELKVGAGG
jgi:thioredoxin-dependent peroxiredoxin